MLSFWSSPISTWLRHISLGVALLSLAACATPHHHAVAHRGLSSDGYGFVENGPVLGPPEHLMQHSTPTPTAQH